MLTRPEQEKLNISSVLHVSTHLAQRVLSRVWRKTVSSPPAVTADRREEAVEKGRQEDCREEVNDSNEYTTEYLVEYEEMPGIGNDCLMAPGLVVEDGKRFF